MMWPTPTIIVLDDPPEPKQTGLVDHLGRSIVVKEIKQSIGFYQLSEEQDDSYT